jgi:hypothetical protein
MTDPTRIQIKFVSPDGTSQDGPSFDLPDPAVAAAALASKHAEIASWRELADADITAAGKHLIGMIRRCDPSTREMLRAIHAAGRSKAAYELLADPNDLDAKARSAFLAVWTESGHHIRREVADDIVLLDALRCLLPGYAGPSIQLFRGETWNDFSYQTYGMCWTSSREVGEGFARGWNAANPGGGVLIETLAPPSAILAKSSTTGVCGWESEYIVDRRRLNDIHQLARFPEIS